MLTLEEFKKALNLEKRGFVNCHDYEQYGENYKKNCNDGVVYIDFGFTNGKYMGISAHIYFKQIEELVAHFPVSPTVIDHHLTISPTKLIGDSVEIYHINKKTQDIVLTENNLEDILGLIHQYLTLFYEPFWEKYSVLQTVNDEIIDKIENSKMTEYIPGSLMTWKKLAIMKVCNNPNYQSYVAWLDSIWAKKALNEDLSRNDSYLAYQTLLKKLERL